MAIDTAEKRKAISGVGGPPLIPGVTPLGSALDQGWRQEAAWSYSGILATAPTAVAQASVMTMWAGIVGIAGTKYRVRIKQSEGSGAINTVAGVSTLRATFHAQSRLLQSDTTILATADSWLDKSNPDSSARSTLILLTALSGVNAAHPVLEFDISALTGLVWKSAKIRLTYDGGDSTGGNYVLVRRVLQPMVTNDASWNQWDNTLVSPEGDWATAGGQNPTQDSEQATQVTWTLVNGTAPGTTILSPDITDIAQDAIENDSGILKVILIRDGGAHQFHSLEAVVGNNLKPAIIFEAF